jgi:hypothetical protein
MDVVSQSLAECFAKTQELCGAVGARVVEVTSSRNNSLGLEISRNGNQWRLTVDCDWPPLGSLPAVHLVDNEQLLAHVSCTGWVCVNDSEALSIDLSRHSDTVAQTVVAALDLLEHSLGDTNQGYVEFFNELEGYWSNLPETTLGKTAVEVDEHSRVVSSYSDVDDISSIPYFLEVSATKPIEFPKEETRVHRAIYVALESAVLPPAPKEPLAVDYLLRLVGEFDSAQQSLWSTLLGNSPEVERVALLVSMPRSAGGRSLIGFTFGVVDAQPNPDSPIVNLLMVRHTVSHMRERGGADLQLGCRHVAVFGCGSVGSEVADALATSGVGKLTLVDPQLFASDNVFRHVLGPYWIGTSKVRALQATLLTRYPGIEVEAIVDSAYRWLLSNTKTDVDGFMLALGMPTLERQLGRALRQCHPNVPVVHTWLEPLDLGGHAILVNSSGQGCLDCLYRDDEGVDSLSSRTSYLEAGQTLTRNLTGCASTFTPYGAIQSRRTALLAAEQMLEALNGGETPRYTYWTGSGTAAAAHGLRVTAWWHRAKSNSALAMTRPMFGSGCKHCRARK